MTQQVIIAVIITFAVAFILSYVLAKKIVKKDYESKMGSAEEKARAIIDEALTTAETKKRESLLEVKEQSLALNVLYLLLVLEVL